MNARPTVLCLGLLAACSPPQAVGRYQTDADTMLRAFEATLPADGSAASKAAVERLRGMAREGGQSWRITLEVRADGTFDLTMQLPLLPEPQQRQGTWERRDDVLVLTTTRDRGRTLETPGRTEVLLMADGVILQESPAAPRFLLHRQ